MSSPVRANEAERRPMIVRCEAKPCAGENPLDCRQEFFNASLRGARLSVEAVNRLTLTPALQQAVFDAHSCCIGGSQRPL
jgi:hypothetical protein